MTPEILEKLLEYLDADFYGDKKDALKSELRELVHDRARATRRPAEPAHMAGQPRRPPRPTTTHHTG